MLLVENHMWVRRALRDWLAVLLPELRLIEADSGEAALTVVRAELPDVVLMDVGLPGMSGIEATSRIMQVCPSSKIIMLTSHESNEYRRQALRAGAVAYVSKRKMRSDLLPALVAMLGADSSKRNVPKGGKDRV